MSDKKPKKPKKPELPVEETSPAPAPILPAAGEEKPAPDTIPAPPLVDPYVPSPRRVAPQE